uniref:Uncharacterized protein n=1 Tax=Anguilla anguilla TaxID=7936 RepID=A0A0E9RK47_ANGAN
MLSGHCLSHFQNLLLDSI